MDTLLWVLQIALATVFSVTGGLKLLRTREQLAPLMRWVSAWSQAGVSGVGFAEVLGAGGLLLPAATGIVPLLTPLAALGLAGLMAGATVVNVRHDDRARVPLTIVLGLMALVIAYGRLLLAPL